MADPSPPSRFVCWLRRCWLQCFTPRRRIVVRHTKPTLEQLEDHNAPTPTATGSVLEIAPPPPISPA
jgi:hypothetical protein